MSLASFPSLLRRRVALGQRVLQTLPVAVVALVALVAAAEGDAPKAPADPPAESVFRDTIDVRWVEIEVVVTDSEGRPVAGLDVDDFRLRVDGEEREILHFAAFEGGRRVAESTADGVLPRTLDDRLHLVLYVDRSFMEPGELPDVVSAVNRFLHAELRPADRVMLVEAAPDLRILHPFTSIPELVVEQLRRLDARPASSRVLVDVPRLLNEIDRAAQRPFGSAGGSLDEVPMALRAEIETLDLELRHEIHRAAHQLRRLLPALGGLPGRTTLVYVGGTVPTEATARLDRAWLRAFGPGSRLALQQQDDPLRLLRLEDARTGLRLDSTEMIALFEEVAEEASADGIRIHALDTGAMRRGATVSRATAETIGGGSVGGSGAGELQSLRALAERTGGRLVVQQRDYSAALAAIAADLQTRYVVGFEIDEPTPDAREVEVALRPGLGRDLAVAARGTFRARDSDHRTADRAVTALILGETHNPLGLRVVAGEPTPPSGEPATELVPLLLRLPVDRLTTIPDPASGHHLGRFSVYLTSGDLERGAAPVRLAVVPVRIRDEDAAGDRERFLDYRLELAVRPGSEKVAVAIRDEWNPLVATAVVVVPRSSETGPPRRP